MNLNETDISLKQKADKYIPGGMYGHQTVKNLTTSYPQFLSGGKGAEIFDMDGKSYIDLMCSYGPIVLGHQNSKVDYAAQAQSQIGDCLNAPGPKLVELCELLVNSIRHADWAILAKNGTDATTACLTIARAKTKKSIILAVKGSYHGAAPWCTPSLAGVLPTDRAAMKYFNYNDFESFESAVKESGDDLAGVIITPFKHIEGQDQELVNPDFAALIRKTCTDKKAALILDDVRCGFRLSTGSSWEPLGVEPDLSAWSKAIANGYPLAAIVGSDEWREAASQIFVTGSFWYNSVPMAAAIATIHEIQDKNVPKKLEELGNRLKKTFEDQALSCGLKISYTGHVSMPYLTFEIDKFNNNYVLMETFCNEMLTQGVYVAPRHNWFLSLSHLDTGIEDRIYRASEASFAKIKIREEVKAF